MPKEYVIHGMHNTSIVINDNETIGGFATDPSKGGGATREGANIFSFAEARSRVAEYPQWKEIVALIDTYVPVLIINTN